MSGCCCIGLPIHLPAKHWGTWVFAFVFYDLCYYWNHRWGHTVGLFWASHVVHHQSEEFNLTTALRQPGTGAFLSWIFYLPMALCGIPVAVMLMVGVAQLFYQFWPHTQLIGRLGFLDRWIQTPSNHRVHHAQNDIYLDKNYVGVFLIWDRLFGSFQEELDEEPCIFGIRGQLNSWNPVWANLHYYVAMAKDSWHAASWSDKVRVWFAPPGWRPADVAARFPKRPYDPRVDFVKFDPPRNVALSAYGLVQFVALIAANSQFLALLPKQATALNVAYFLFILGSLVCLGGVLENRREFLIAEAARLTATALVVLLSRRLVRRRARPARGDSGGGVSGRIARRGCGWPRAPTSDPNSTECPRRYRRIEGWKKRYPAKLQLLRAAHVALGGPSRSACCGRARRWPYAADRTRTCTLSCRTAHLRRMAGCSRSPPTCRNWKTCGASLPAWTRVSAAWIFWSTTQGSASSRAWRISRRKTGAAPST